MRSTCAPPRYTGVGVASSVAGLRAREVPDMYAWISDSVKQWIMGIATGATDSLCRRNSDKEVKSVVQPPPPQGEPTPDVVILSTSTTSPPEVDPTTVLLQGDPTILPQQQMLDTLLKNLPSQILPMLPSQLFATSATPIPQSNRLAPDLPPAPSNTGTSLPLERLAPDLPPAPPAASPSLNRLAPNLHPAPPDTSLLLNRVAPYLPPAPPAHPMQVSRFAPYSYWPQPRFISHW